MNLVGEHVGNYVVTRELGAGGMGTVYLAEHPVLKRRVAIKVLHDEHAMDPDTVERFFQEARAAAEIGEEHIIEVIDFGELMVRGWKVVYLMMELLDGISLGKRIARGALSPDEVAHVVAQICLALAASHAKGIIHRDLKPENVYLCPRASDPAFVKVLDFGIAKLTGPIKGSGRATRIGTVLGTPAYMSPEQCVGIADVDRRADIYALGVMMFEMLTGQLPFDGDVGALIDAHLRRAPDPPSRRNPAVPPAWDAIVLHCLEKARDDRFGSMEELAAAVRDPAAHLAGYREREAARARVAALHRTAVLPPELRPDHGAAREAGGGLAVHATPPPLTPPPFGLAPSAPQMPSPLPFSTPVPDGTPPPFRYAPPPAEGLRAPASTPPAMAAPAPRGVSTRLVLGAIGFAVVVALVVLGVARLFDVGGGGGGTPARAPGPLVALDAGAVALPDAMSVAVSVAVPAAVPAAGPEVATVAIPDAGVPASPIPAPLRLTIRSTPSGAKVTVRRGALRETATTPHVVELPAGTDQPVSITVTARGFATVTQTVTPHADAEVVIVLPRRAAPIRQLPRRDSDLIRPE